MDRVSNKGEPQPLSDLPSNWGITAPDQLLRSLRVAETGGDIAECADAFEWMLRSDLLVDRDTIDIEAALMVAIDTATWGEVEIERLFAVAFGTTDD